MVHFKLVGWPIFRGFRKVGLSLFWFFRDFSGTEQTKLDQSKTLTLRKSGEE